MFPLLTIDLVRTIQADRLREARQQRRIRELTRHAHSHRRHLRDSAQ